MLVVNIIDRGREGRQGGGNDLRDQQVSGSDMACTLLPESSNQEWGEGAGLEKSRLGPSPNTSADLEQREEVSEPDLFFLLFPQIRPKKDRSALFGLGGGSFLWGPRRLWRREAKSPAFIQRISITLTCSGLVFS